MSFRRGDVVAVCEDRGAVVTVRPGYSERMGTVIAIHADNTIRIQTPDGFSARFAVNGGRAKGCLNVWFEPRAADPALHPDAKQAAFLARLRDLTWAQR